MFLSLLILEHLLFKDKDISNILSKATGSTNAINVVKAVEYGLKQLKDPVSVARQRGISLKNLFE